MKRRRLGHRPLPSEAAMAAVRDATLTSTARGGHAARFAAAGNHTVILPRTAAPARATIKSRAL